MTRTDVAQAEARHAAAISQLDLARANLKSSLANFERTIGRPPDRPHDQQPCFKLLPKTLPAAIDIAQRETPAVIGALYTEQAARHNVDLIWGELLPSVRLDANYSHRYDTNPAVDETQSTTVRGVLDVPLYEAGDVRARIRAAKHTHVSRIQQIEQARTEAKAATISSWSSVTAAKAQLQSDHAQVKATKIALEGVRSEERVGQRTLLDVLNAEQEALNAQVTLATTKRNLVVASYALLAAIGRLSITDLDAVERAYDPEANYNEVRRNWWGVSITYRDGRRERMDLWESHGAHHEAKH
ncbi:MAG: TolC family protein [Hyphomicrobiaceae bacterium]